MTYQNRMSLREQRKQEQERRLKEMQNILGLGIFALGTIIMLILDLTGVVFCCLGAYAIMTENIIIPYKEVDNCYK